MNGLVVKQNALALQPSKLFFQCDLVPRWPLGQLSDDQYLVQRQLGRQCIGLWQPRTRYTQHIDKPTALSLI